MDACDVLSEMGAELREGRTNTLNSNVPSDLRTLATYYRDCLENLRAKYNGNAASCPGYEVIPAFDPIPE